MDDRYIWLDFVYSLMDKLKLKETEVYEMTYVHCLNWLGYFKNKEELNKKNEL